MNEGEFHTTVSENKGSWICCPQTQTISIQREVTESNTPKGLFNGQVVKTSFRLVMTAEVFLVHSDMLKGQGQQRQKHRLLGELSCRGGEGHIFV